VTKEPTTRAKTGATYTNGTSVNADNKMKTVAAIKRAIGALSFGYTGSCSSAGSDAVDYRPQTRSQ